MGTAAGQHQCFVLSPEQVREQEGDEFEDLLSAPQLILLQFISRWFPTRAALFPNLRPEDLDRFELKASILAIAAMMGGLPCDRECEMWGCIDPSAAVRVTPGQQLWQRCRQPRAGLLPVSKHTPPPHRSTTH